MAHKKSCQALLLSSKTTISHFLQNILTRCHRKLKFSISRTGCIVSHTCLFLCFPIHQGTYSSPALTSSPSSPAVFSVPPPKCLLCLHSAHHRPGLEPLSWKIIDCLQETPTWHPCLQFHVLLTCRVTHRTPALSTFQYLSFPDKTQTPLHDLPTSPASATDISSEFSYRPFRKELPVDPRVSTYLLPFWTPCP